ncbi:MAG: DUF4381 domain-containing protein [Gammaproteobacteria bacterium]|nr:DUF4381 domain-containing protein [Gammaproteobacteria bacterium]MCY4200115.1 DUF4381 domain-containing protein [Gammaproteobacteria bacterium]MCY4322183.1 DUF4381 domain-containing protein [Gammaproteobacteria bacterium]
MSPDVLSELRGLHLPEPPGFLPPAPGWWLLLVVLFAAAMAAYWRYRQRARSMRPLREAMTDLGACNLALLQGELAPMPYLDSVNALLKRLLVHGYGKTEIIHLSSDGWVRTLDQFLRASLKSDAGVRIETTLLGEFRYRPHSHPESSSCLQDELKTACEQLGYGLKVAMTTLAPPEVRHD